MSCRMLILYISWNCCSQQWSSECHKTFSHATQSRLPSHLLIPNSEKRYTGQSHKFWSVRIEWKKRGQRQSVQLDVVGRVKDISAHDKEGRVWSHAESHKPSRELYLKVNKSLFLFISKTGFGAIEVIWNLQEVIKLAFKILALGTVVAAVHLTHSPPFCPVCIPSYVPTLCIPSFQVIPMTLRLPAA